MWLPRFGAKIQIGAIPTSVYELWKTAFSLVCDACLIVIFLWILQFFSFMYFSIVQQGQRNWVDHKSKFAVWFGVGQWRVVEDIMECK